MVQRRWLFALCGELDQRAAINNGITDPGTPDGEIRFERLNRLSLPVTLAKE
jgi:hypothetical protein